MKKVTCLLLVLVLVCSMGASALATDGINVRSEEFDTSVFQGVPNIGVDYDDMENKGYIYLVDPTPSLFMLTPDASYYSRIYPNIFYDKYRISFSIYMDFIAKKPAGINSMIVKIGDKRYRFKDIKRYTIDWDNMTTSNTEVLEGAI